ncbi:DNA topoisomerase VI subunit B [Candidatus Haloredivivus sp. G17]|nr:DNA topoisomerase VI subunit B [Candidatus Haloredivivus sp. G17]
MPNGIEDEIENEGGDHREISVAEFFEKNKHLLGFENAQKSIITVVKEAVDNSLDACEGDEILPEIHVLIDEIGDKKCRVEIRDNAIGLDRETIPKVFGKLLYGSKFHKLQQSRGQQGGCNVVAGHSVDQMDGSELRELPSCNMDTHNGYSFRKWGSPFSKDI